MTLGAVTGPELEYAADFDFHSVWVPIDDLAGLPVFPRCVAEAVAAGLRPGGTVPWIEDDRSSWDGIDDAHRPSNVARASARAVIVADGGLAAIERSRDGEQWFVLPGGGIEEGETPQDAAGRAVREELGLDLSVEASLAVVVHVRGGLHELQTYLWCELVGEPFGRGKGFESSDGYRPVWLDIGALPATLRPTWLADRLPSWIADPAPERPERFNEVHD